MRWGLCLVGLFLTLLLQRLATPGRFFGIPPWYEYLDVEVNPYTRACELHMSLTKSNGQIDFTAFSLIGLGILDILIRVAALVAVAFVIYGGIQYITSQGEPDRFKRATGTIVNALIGLVIAVLAATVVRFIGNRVGA